MTLQLAFWLFGIAFLLFALRWLFPGVSINSTGEVLAVATLVTIGGLIVLSLRLHYRDFFRNVAIWSGIVLVLAVAYAFRHEIGMVADRVAGVATSERGYSAGDAMVFERDRNGHFLVRADISGREITFLVDTGASNVVLSPKDAQKLGINPRREQFFERYYTANGVVMGAPVILPQISIGDHIHIENVRASVTEGDLHMSLLGMSFLNRLGGFEITGERLTLRP
ncbi:aspartic protease [Iodidimonas muriae]|uniref:Aspartic protease n=1 Tax=Iodidimonas muriae TaxID=261467 RepID=A0ABQ2L849_9PROT|nr:TIGR02281 family clan AA aspartic protease [Iodidimonas muriae]GGO06392.1 aspartic protease [Iodidimonas muriae]